MNHARFPALLVLVALMATGCAGSPSAAPPTAVREVTISTATPPTFTTPTLPTLAVKTSTAASPATAGEYPKFVPKSTVDSRYSQWAKGDRMVMLAPGVYSEATPDGVMGTLDDYSTYVGSCTAIKRYTESHLEHGHACW
jgi:hypothetical protein